MSRDSAHPVLLTFYSRYVILECISSMRKITPLLSVIMKDALTAKESPCTLKKSIMNHDNYFILNLLLCIHCSKNCVSVTWVCTYVTTCTETQTDRTDYMPSATDAGGKNSTRDAQSLVKNTIIMRVHDQ